MKKYTHVEEYILDFPEIAQNKMQGLREIIKSLAPNCKEIISYNMPAYKQNGIVVYFAAYKSHIGFYPTPNGITTFESQLGKINTQKEPFSSQ